MTSYRDALHIHHSMVAKPTEAQSAAGNYRKHKVSVHGMPITIENPKGSARTGKDKDGTAWSVKMPAHYGYLLGTVGRDKDHVDCYLGDNLKSSTVYVVNQIDHKSGKFDEHKCMIGYASQSDALSDYKKAFSDGNGKDRIGSVAEMPIDRFKSWLKTGDMKVPARTGYDAGGEVLDAMDRYAPSGDPDFTRSQADFLRSERALAGTGSAQPYNQSWRDKAGEAVSDAYTDMTGSKAAGDNLARYALGTSGLGRRQGDGLMLPVIPPAIDAIDSAVHGNYGSAVGSAALAGIDAYGGRLASAGMGALAKGPWLKHAPEEFSMVSKNGLAYVNGRVNGNELHVARAGRMENGQPVFAGARPNSPNANTVGPREIRDMFGQLRDEYPYATHLNSIRVSGSRGAAAENEALRGSYGQPTWVPDRVIAATDNVADKMLSPSMQNKYVDAMDGMFPDPRSMRIKIPRGY